MKVLLVTSWGTRCGIAEHSARLKQSVEAANSSIEVIPDAEALDPDSYSLKSAIHDDGIDLVHLNHHDALHSRWQPSHVQRLMEQGVPVVLTYHDTRVDLSLCPKLEAMAQVCASTIVHEPVEGLKAIYWRQGVPAPAEHPACYHPVPMHEGWQDCRGIFHASTDDWLAFPQQPILGSVGFNFPWKNFTRLAEETGRAGWALVLIAHDATEEQVVEWRRLNPSSLVLRDFLPQDQVVNALAGCDATAFMYECANTGTSGAIRQGIAARKPVIALSTCRQFRDLLQLDYAGEPGLLKSGIRWVGDWNDFRDVLTQIVPTSWDPAISHLAHCDSWATLGANYAALYRMLAGASR